MTEIADAPIADRRTRRPRLQLPKLALGAAIVAIARAVGQAFEMAYVAPYQTRRAPPVSTQMEDGRDPRW